MTRPDFPSSPIECPRQTVLSDWIDYNGHMNMAFYNLAFDRAVDYVYDQLGIGAAYTATGAGSCFVREVHVNYLAELMLDSPLRITFQLLDRDRKRLHYFLRMAHADEGFLAATSEQLALHVSMTSRRTEPFPADAAVSIDALFDAHRQLPRAVEVGRSMGIRR